jgi:hypothetical protein
MDIALNKIAKDEMSKRLRGTQITTQGWIVWIISSCPPNLHISIYYLFRSQKKKSIEQTA